MSSNEYFSIKFEDGRVTYLDQTVLPLEENYITTGDYEVLAKAIEGLEVRGAPLIGITAAYGLALAIKDDASRSQFEKAYNRLLSTRPTAVNLSWALNRLKHLYESAAEQSNRYELLLDKAREIHEDDIAMCRRMGENGLQVFPGKAVVITHCNTGKLATGGDGTAFAVIKAAHEHGLIEHVYADETRPLLQGSRLTAYELDKSGIPFSIQPDNAAASLMASGKVDLVITGSDRIAANGDAANKIGTYMLALCCKHHGIPFYIAAPSSTIDPECPDGSHIPIEQRKAEEITSIRETAVTHPSYPVHNPAFDVTPADLIAGIITEKDCFKPPYDFSR